MPLSEIARKVRLAKSTVLYHLEKLIEERIVEKTEDGQYKLAERNLRRDILKVIADITPNKGKRLIDVEYVIKKVKKYRTINQNKIEKTIEDLTNCGLIRRIGNQLELTKDGAEILGVCTTVYNIWRFFIPSHHTSLTYPT